MWYEKLANQLNSLLSTVMELRISVSAAVVTAIIIFVAKEFLEWRRKEKSKQRKMAAIYRLVAFELEKNFHAIRGYGSCLREIKLNFKSCEELDFYKVKYSIATLPSGKRRFTVKRDDEHESGRHYPKVQSSILESKLEDIAELDKDSFLQTLEALENLKTLDHLVSSLADYFEPDSIAWLEGFVDYADRELDVVCYHLRRYYERIGGMEKDIPIERNGSERQLATH